jgi:UDP-N-acetylglucosamine 1-carboxyvinyltransferase
MALLRIQGGSVIDGQITASSAKNSVINLIAAALLADGVVTLSNVPHLRDVSTMIELLSNMGVIVVINDRMELEIHPNTISTLKAPYELVKTMRASFNVLGPLIARYGEAEVSLPGGCAIGTRPVDQHLKGLRALGADIAMYEGYVKGSVQGRLKGARVVFDFSTVGGTEHLMMAAALAEGVTLLENCAKEPEIIDLANFLNLLGADIRGAGTSQIRIEGAERLDGGAFEAVSDRIEVGTYLIAAAATGGRLEICNAMAEHNSALLEKLREAGAEISTNEGKISLDMQGQRPRAVNIVTGPYPAFPTDLQAQMMTLNCLAEGACSIQETIFENRFMHVPELARMGAEIQLQNNNSVALVKGVGELIGAPVMATDLRASASLVIAGIAASGETTVDRVYHIDRGYQQIEERLQRLGVNIKREAG